MDVVQSMGPSSSMCRRGRFGDVVSFGERLLLIRFQVGARAVEHKTKHGNDMST